MNPFFVWYGLSLMRQVFFIFCQNLIICAIKYSFVLLIIKILTMNKRKEHFVTVDEIAEITGKSPNYIRKAIANGHIEPFKPQLYVLIPRKNIIQPSTDYTTLNLSLGKLVYTRQSVDAWSTSLQGHKRTRIKIIATTENDEKEFTYKSASAFFNVAPNTIKNTIKRDAELSADDTNWKLKFKE